MRASVVLVYFLLGCACNDPAPSDGAPCDGRPSDPTTQEAELAAVLPKTVLAHGTTSAIPTQRLAVARDAAAWRALWAEHCANLFPPPPPPEVDFSTHMVVAVFLGTRTSGGYEVAIDECAREGARLVVRARESRPEAGAMLTAALTAPYEFVLVPPAPGTPALELTP